MALGGKKRHKSVGVGGGDGVGVDDTMGLCYLEFETKQSIRRTHDRV